MIRSLVHRQHPGSIWGQAHCFLAHWYWKYACLWKAIVFYNKTLLERIKQEHVHMSNNRKCNAQYNVQYKKTPLLGIGQFCNIDFWTRNNVRFLSESWRASIVHWEGQWAQISFGAGGYIDYAKEGQTLNNHLYLLGSNSVVTQPKCFMPTFSYRFHCLKSNMNKKYNIKLFFPPILQTGEYMMYVWWL